MSGNVAISIVIPVYNSEKSIAVMVEKLREFLQNKVTFEIILVNDGSKDNSGRIIRELGQKYDNVTAISLSKNFGQHNAIMAGFNNACGEFIVTMDDDLQHPVEEILKLADFARANDYDAVYGEYLSKNHSLLKNLGSEMNNLMADWIIKKPREIRFTSFRVIRSYVVREIVKYKAPYPYIDGLILRVTNKVGKVTIQHNERKYGKSNYTVRKLLRLWMNGFMNFSIIPLRLFTTVGILIAIIGFVAATVILFETIFLYKPLPGWTSLIVSTLIFSGVQLASIGMVGEYVGRIFLTQNGTPQYVIKENSQKRKDLKVEED